MRTPKDAVLDLVNYLPEDASIEDIQYHLYVLQKIRKGLKDDDEDRVISQSEMEKRFEKWLEKKGLKNSRTRVPKNQN